MKKKQILYIGPLVCLLFGFASVVNAQTPSKTWLAEAPALPMDIRLRYSSQYFEQSFSDDPRYARIVAMVDNERCDVILLDKATDREVFYSTSTRKLQNLAASGDEAYSTPILFSSSSTIDSYHLFFIYLHDHFGQEITWQFVAGETLPHASPEVISRTDNSGITLLYAPRRAVPMYGTEVTIATKTYRPKAAVSTDAIDVFYATDMTVGRISHSIDLWTVEADQADVAGTSNWHLRGTDGRQRILALKQLSDTEAEIDQSDPDDPDAPQMKLDVGRTNDSYGLRELSFKVHDNTLWIFFGPLLPLPAHGANDKTTATFTVAENEQANVARGELVVQRSDGREHLLWRFDTPDLAKNVTFETGVNLVPGTGEQANCMNQDCLLFTSPP